MIILSSPSKQQKFSPQNIISDYSKAVHLEQAAFLAKNIARLGVKELGIALKISPRLAQQTHKIYQNWDLPFTPKNAKQAILAYSGELFEYMQPKTFSYEDFMFAQKHLRIISGLYGLLKPLDLIQAYRLDIGANFVTPKAKNIYQYWGYLITQAIKNDLDNFEKRIVVNLASHEYERAVVFPELDAHYVHVIFKQTSRWGRVVGRGKFCKQVRGAMIRYIVKNKITDLEALKDFSLMDYSFQKKESDARYYYFVQAPQFSGALQDEVDKEEEEMDWDFL